VIGAVGVHGTDHADVVDALADIGEYLAELDAALSEFLELKWGLQQVAGFALGLQVGGGHRLAVVLGEHRLGVEGVHLAWAAVEKQEDYALGFGGEVRRGVSSRLLQKHCLAKVAKNAKKTNTILLGVLGELGAILSFGFH